MRPYYDSGGVTIFLGDCRDILPQLPLPVTHVMADPPYNVGKDYGAKGSDRLPEDEYRGLIEGVSAWSHLSARSQTWLAPKKHLRFYLSAFPSAHLVVIRRGAGGPLRDGWSDQYDLLLATGKPLQVFRDLWDDIRLKGEGYFFREDDYGHPGYTPAPIIRRCISLFTETGETVLDPFAGSGTTGRAAKDLGRKAILIEREERWCEVAAQRMSQEVLPIEVPA